MGLRPILFFIFICDLFSIVSNIDFAIYADNNTLYVVGENTKEVIETLENSSKELMQQLYNNRIKANAVKCHLLTSSNEKPTISIDNYIIVNS